LLLGHKDENKDYYRDTEISKGLIVGKFEVGGIRMETFFREYFQLINFGNSFIKFRRVNLNFIYIMS
jgi:hypothetical protein